MSNAINWFEIFVSDLDRAVRFYEGTMDIRLRREDFGGTKMAVFPHAERTVGGALVYHPERPAGGGGTLVYLDAGGKLDACLDRVKGAGGEVVQPKTDIGDPGFIATVRDSEGNVVGLHSER